MASAMGAVALDAAGVNYFFGVDCGEVVGELACCWVVFCDIFGALAAACVLTSVTSVNESGPITIATGSPFLFFASTKKDEGMILIDVNPALLRFSLNC